ncbi:MAG: hypothetical protein K9L32_04865 [Chromatiaceae bacterium]|nr:hypothetical protein [Chromatiaceae bacterium]
MGGSLELIARFPDRPDVNLVGLFSHDRLDDAAAQTNKDETTTAQHGVDPTSAMMGRSGIKPQAVKGSWHGHQPGDVSGTVNHADNLNTVDDLPV